MRCHQLCRLLVAVSIAAYAGPAGASLKQGPYEQGLLEADMDHYPKAAELFTAAIEEDPKNADAYAQRARCEMNLNQMQQMYADANHAIQLDPKSAYAYSFRGYAEMMMHNYRAGIEDCDKAIELHGLAPYNLSVSHDYENRDKALRLIGRADLIGADKTKLEALAFVKQAVDKREAGQLSDSKKLLDQAIKIDPDNKAAWFLRGVVYSNMREFWKSSADFTHVIRDTPDAPSGYYFRADCYEQLGEHKKAIDDYSKIIAMKPRLVAFSFVCETGRLRDHFEGKDVAVVNLTDIYYLRAQSRYSLGDLKGASADLAEVIRRDPADKAAVSQNADLTLAQGKSRTAINDYDNAIKLSPKDWQAYHQRAEAYERLGNYDKAIADYSEIIKLNPKDAGAYLLRARLYDKLDRPADAIVDYSTIISLNPSDDDAYRCRGLCYVKTKKYQEAVNDFTNAIELNPSSSASAYEARANAFKELGKPDLAAKDLEAADIAGGNRPTADKIKNAPTKTMMSVWVIAAAAGALLVMSIFAVWFIRKKRD
jgi:tetratricopeptide (TPR) repeat protein